MAEKRGMARLVGHFQPKLCPSLCLSKSIGRHGLSNAER